ncbi:MAG: hypothetical protein ACE5IY_08840 [bacterium]
MDTQEKNGVFRVSTFLVFVFSVSMSWLTPEIANSGFTAWQEKADKGREILRQAVQAAGGVATFKKLENFTIKTESEITGRQVKTRLTVTETMQLPDKTKQIMELDAGTRIQVLNGNDSWKQINNDVSDVSALEKKEMQRGVFRDMRNLFKHFESAELKVTYLSQQVVAGKNFHVLQIKDFTGDFFNLYIDADTFLIHKMTYRGAAEVDLAKMEEIYSDYREVDGIKIPFHIIVKANGRQFIDAVVIEAEINSELDKEFFYQ